LRGSKAYSMPGARGKEKENSGKMWRVVERPKPCAQFLDRERGLVTNYRTKCLESVVMGGETFTWSCRIRGWISLGA